MKSAVLIGNPSVGKSVIFNALTGLGVEISNYPGTTVTTKSGVVKFGDSEFTLTDLPGIYSLSGDSTEETMVREYLVTENPDLFIAVLDASHLERNLYLLLQIADIQKPLLVVLNMIDDAVAAGKIIDSAKLSEKFGVPVIPTVATQGKNLNEIAKYIVGDTLPAPNLLTRFDHHIEAAEVNLQRFHNVTIAEALFALEGAELSTLKQEVIESASAIDEEIKKRHEMSSEQIIATNRHNSARKIADEVTSEAPKKKKIPFDSLLTKTFPGIPILILIMVGILVIVFLVGGWLEELIVTLMTNYIQIPFDSLELHPLLTTVGDAVILALMSGLGIAFPYVFLFYIFISILEDTGYLTRAAFLADRFMHKLGLHGQGLIPLVLSFGCSVPAIMSTRLLPTKRERFIASILVTMLPCSARTVVISGIVAAFIGFGPALSIYAIVFVLVFVVGCILSKVTPGEQYGMILEMAEIRKPIPKYVIRKSWMRVKEFLFIAMPLLLISSVILGICQYLGWVDMFMNFIDPASMAVLGIPGFALTALLFGILRKEMAFETLAVMAGTTELLTVLSAGQLYIFAIVCVLFVPCISTIAVLMREHGAKKALLIAMFTLILGLLMGFIFNIIFKFI
ncbi:MAG TPA: ferrous iron transport protein B [Methanocorpusculum sp.]|nr:ferrous iron transport protein B [Methanocorpusculum sp.]HJJ39668.1 ferrous iron transport protein B [Methanocorpusculum sp.]HJJ49277.1 ferrous iron transport protein B [Methanocorpusculum sp.]HJJ56679.1 ferrous iron transport protein B [Methanocorpusculum sp.]